MLRFTVTSSGQRCLHLSLKHICPLFASGPVMLMVASC